MITHIETTHEDIVKGEPDNSVYCPNALAINRAMNEKGERLALINWDGARGAISYLGVTPLVIPLATEQAANYYDIPFNPDGLALARWIDRYDNRQPVSPCSYDLDWDNKLVLNFKEQYEESRPV